MVLLSGDAEKFPEGYLKHVFAMVKNYMPYLKARVT
jgi:hypothetical protein